MKEYGTHLPMLIHAVMNSSGPVLECGCGHWSTPVLHELCRVQERELVTVDNDPKWLEEFQRFRSSNHTLVYVEDWEEIYPRLQEDWGVVFIDCHPPKARGELLERAHGAEYVVAHDTEHFEQEWYGWHTRLVRYRHWYEDRTSFPYTSVLSDRFGVWDFRQSPPLSPEALERVGLVTAFVPTDHTRYAYTALGKRLLDLPVRHRFFCRRVEDCWFQEDAEIPLDGNPAKNTLDYFKIILEKPTWIRKAYEECKQEVLAWVDYGIFHLPDVTDVDIMSFFERLRPEDKIVLGGFNELTEAPIDMDHPGWYCLGGVMIVPRHMAAWFEAAVQADVRAYHAQTGRVSWETNHIARVAQKHPNKFRFYRCGFDRTLFTNYSSG